MGKTGRLYSPEDSVRLVTKVLSGRVKEPQQPARRIVVDLGHSLGGHQAALVSPVQVTPITG
jgi:hypothetical protein